MVRIWGEMARLSAGRKRVTKGIKRAKQPQSPADQWRHWDAAPAIEAEIWRPPIGAGGGRTPAGVQIGSDPTLLEIESGHLPMNHLPWPVP